MSSMTIASQPLSSFLDQVASSEPTPGGGSVAALSGALGASLVAMVCRLTIGKKNYESVSEEMQAILRRAEKLEHELRDLLQADSDAYARVMDAYKLPKSTDAEKSARANAIQDALKHASDVPLQAAECCLHVLELARPVSEKGNKNAASDGGVGALMAEAGLRGAALNVSINLASIADQTFVREHRQRIDQLIADADALKREILQTVKGRI
jgi:formiminotetrahydrofolate cyclodeaminase